MDYLKNILEELECMVCHKYMYREIPMCNKGHSICKECKEKLQVCPLCKGKYIVGIRNFSLEKIGEKILKPCKFYGCNEVFDEEGLKNHKYECKYGYECPFSIGSDCDWIGSYTNILEHVLRHDKLALEKVFVYETLEMKLYMAHGEIFSVIKRKMIDNEYNGYHALFHGPIEKANDFIMVIKFGDLEMDTINLTYTQPCTSVKGLEKSSGKISTQSPILISSEYDNFNNKSKYPLDIGFIQKEKFIELSKYNISEKKYIPPHLR